MASSREITDTPEWRAFFELSKEWQDLLGFLAMSKSDQMKVGRSMRHNAKGLVTDIPRCVRCKRISVLTVCRRCASPKQLAEYPALETT